MCLRRQAIIEFAVVKFGFSLTIQGMKKQALLCQTDYMICTYSYGYFIRFFVILCSFLPGKIKKIILLVAKT